MPTPTTVSTCTSVTEQGTHLFHIYQYSEHRGMGYGEYISSGAFSVGGYDWAILFYPDGLDMSSAFYISVRLELLSKDAKVRAACDLRLVDQTTGLSHSITKTHLKMFNSNHGSHRFSPNHGQFMQWVKFKDSAYLRDDHLTIVCIVTVKGPRLSATEFLHAIEVPPPDSDIREQLGQLMGATGGAYVTFSVGGETFTARKDVLALRSPVFRAELYGPMSEASTQHVTIQDMQPDVFRALLHFINTDTLPDKCGSDDGDHHGGDRDSTDCELIWHLLVAADRYAMERLQLLCQSILSKNLDAETVSTTLALACQHNCDRLKKICLRYISSPHVMDKMVATQGYKNLKATCPSIVVDIFERMRL